MNNHTQQLVQEVKVQEVQLWEGRVKERESLHNDDSMGWGFSEQGHKKMADGLQNRNGNSRMGIKLARTQQN